MLTEDQKKMIAMNMQKNDMKSFLGMIQGGEGQLNFEVTSSNVTLLPEAVGLFHRLSGTP